MSRVRTFVGIDIDKPIRDRLVSLQTNLGRAGVEVKWVEAHNLHLTLLFLGEVDERQLIDVCRAVAGACAARPAFPLSVETVGCFPNPRRPRVLWAGVGAGAEEVVALHAALEPPLLALGCYRKEDRLYTPHFTLGRVKSEDAPTDALAALLVKKASWHAGEMQVREVLVMSSEMSSKGPEYVVLSRAKLAPS